MTSYIDFIRVFGTCVYNYCYHSTQKVDQTINSCVGISDQNSWVHTIRCIGMATCIHSPLCCPPSIACFHTVVPVTCCAISEGATLTACVSTALENMHSLPETDQDET